ncbi:MAG: nucleotidyltransferase domain-containing protein [Deltaproteobacteria bacterium]|nr:nucleotidyltransferase domain-containing protein [Deltaproteobacteria bacterium]
MDIAGLIREKRQTILEIARRHGAKNVRVFGSVARRESTEESDVDFLIEVEGPTSPWFPGGLVAELEALLGRRVDVVELASLRESMKERILKEAVSL